MSCGCQTSNSNCVREPFNANFVRPLAYVRGVDANGCVSYAPIGSFTINVQDTSTLDFNISNNTISGDVRISSNTGNQLQALANGLYVPPLAGLQIADTNTLDLTLVGTTLSGAVQVSTNAGNQIQALANGLYVPPAFINAIQDTVTVDLNVAGGTLSANVNISPNPGNAIQILSNGLYVASSTFNVIDTNTVDLTFAGNTLSAQVIISPNAGNALQALPNGLFVPATAALTVQDTNTVDLTLAGGILSANVIVSPNAGNALQVLANGLFVPSTASISVQDTQSVDLTLSGGVLSANIIISPNPNNQLQLLANGLYVAPSASNLNVIDTNTVDLNLVGNNLTANVIVSPNAGNALQALANGLFVPSTASISVQDTQSVDLTLNGGVLSANVIISQSAGNALQLLPDGLYVPPGNYSLSNCAGVPLTTGSQVLTCPSAPAPLTINDTLLSFASPNTGQRTMSPKQCPEPLLGDYILAADNNGNVRYIRMQEAIFHSLTPNGIVFPNIPLVTLQPPNTDTGVIDSATFTNPYNCYSVFPKGSMSAVMQHSFNQSNAASLAISRLSNVKDLISRIDTVNTPGITNTPLTSHAWRNQSISAIGFSADRLIELGSGIAPGATVTFNRSVFVQGANNFYYVTVENWNAAINIIKL